MDQQEANPKEKRTPLLFIKLCTGNMYCEFVVLVTQPQTVFVL